MTEEAAMKFEKEKSCKPLAGVGAGTLMGTEWHLLIARDQRGHVTFKRPIFIYKLTLFLTSLLSLLARDMLVIKTAIKISHGQI